MYVLRERETYIYMYVCTYVCMYGRRVGFVTTHTHTHTHTYIYIYIYIRVGTKYFEEYKYERFEYVSWHRIFYLTK